MAGARDFKRLVVWKKAHELALRTYKWTRDFPSSERFSLTNQMQRAAVSIPANIAEGCGRGGEAEMARYLHIAHGSSSELAYYAILAADLEYMGRDDADELSMLVDEVSRMLTAYASKLRAT
ncbi:MAG: four helix bundle protein [Phycisphaeraceae bacterium]